MWSLFRRKAAPIGINIQSAIQCLSDAPSQENRIALYRALNDGMLFLATSAIPSEWGQGPIVLEKATSIAMLTTTAPDGGQALLAFTSHEEVKKRNGACSSFAMRAKDVLKLVIRNEYSALVLNPAGPWAGIPREDVEKILHVGS